MASNTPFERASSPRADIAAAGRGQPLFVLAMIVIVVAALYFGRDIFVPLALADAPELRARAARSAGSAGSACPIFPRCSSSSPSPSRSSSPLGQWSPGRSADLAGQLPTYRLEHRDEDRLAPPGAARRKAVRARRRGAARHRPQDRAGGRDGREGHVAQPRERCAEAGAGRRAASAADLDADHHHRARAARQPAGDGRHRHRLRDLPASQARGPARPLLSGSPACATCRARPKLSTTRRGGSAAIC